MKIWRTILGLSLLSAAFALSVCLWSLPGTAQAAETLLINQTSDTYSASYTTWGTDNSDQTITGDDFYISKISPYLGINNSTNGFKLGICEVSSTTDKTCDGDITYSDNSASSETGYPSVESLFYNFTFSEGFFAESGHYYKLLLDGNWASNPPTLHVGDGRPGYAGGQFIDNSSYDWTFKLYEDEDLGGPTSCPWGYVLINDEVVINGGFGPFLFSNP